MVTSKRLNTNFLEVLIYFQKFVWVSWKVSETLEAPRGIWGRFSMFFRHWRGRWTEADFSKAVMHLISTEINDRWS